MRWNQWAKLRKGGRIEPVEEQPTKPFNDVEVYDLKDIYKESYSSNTDGIEQIAFILKDNASLTEKEIDFISRINDTLAKCENNLELFEKVIPYINVRFDDNLPRVNIVSSNMKYNVLSDIKIYNAQKINISNHITLNLKEFVNLIRENNISMLFAENEIDSLDRNVIDDLNIDDLVNEGYKTLINEIVGKDINCYNRILNKVNFDIPTVRHYCCQFNGMTLTADEEFYCGLNSDIMLCLIVIMHFDEIYNEIEKKKSILEAKYNAERQAYINAIEKKLEVIREEIINDPAFRACTKSNTLKYLKEVLRNADDDVLDYLGMSRTSVGQIKLIGYKGQAFIDEIWEEMRRAK